jgi:hypothetical protein
MDMNHYSKCEIAYNVAHQVISSATTLCSPITYYPNIFKYLLEKIDRDEYDTLVEYIAKELI